MNDLISCSKIGLREFVELRPTLKQAKRTRVSEYDPDHVLEECISVVLG